MRAGLAAATLTILGLATVALAEAPVRSPVPPVRPGPSGFTDRRCGPARGPDHARRAHRPCAPDLAPPAAAQGACPGTGSTPGSRCGIGPCADRLAHSAGPSRRTAGGALRNARPDRHADPTRLAPLVSLIPPVRPDDGGEIVLTSAPGAKDQGQARPQGIGLRHCHHPGRGDRDDQGLGQGMRPVGGCAGDFGRGGAIVDAAQIDCVTAQALNSWVETRSFRRSVRPGAGW